MQVEKIKNDLSLKVSNVSVLQTPFNITSGKSFTNLIVGIGSFLEAGRFKTVYVAVDNNDERLVQVGQAFMMASLLYGIKNINTIENIHERYMWSKLNYTFKDRSTPRLLVIDETTYVKLSKFYKRTVGSEISFDDFLVTIGGYAAVVVIYSFEESQMITKLLVDVEHAELVIFHVLINQYYTDKRLHVIDPKGVRKGTQQMFSIINTRYRRGGYQIHQEMIDMTAHVKLVERYKNMMKSGKPIAISKQSGMMSIFFIVVAAILKGKDTYLDHFPRGADIVLPWEYLHELYNEDIHTLNSLRMSSLMYSNKAKHVKKNMFGHFIKCYTSLNNTIWATCARLMKRKIFVTNDVPELRSLYRYFRKGIFVPVNIGMRHVYNEKTKRLQDAMLIWARIVKHFYYLSEVVVTVNEELVEVSIQIDRQFVKILNDKAVSIADISKDITKFLVDELDENRMIHVKLITSRVRKTHGIPIPMLSQ